MHGWDPLAAIGRAVFLEFFRLLTRLAFSYSVTPLSRSIKMALVVTVGCCNDVSKTVNHLYMHSTTILHISLLSFILESICFIRIPWNIEVGDASRCFSGSGHSDDQDDLGTRYCFDDPMQGVLNIGKDPHLPETELYFLQNVTAANIVKVDRSKRDTLLRKDFQRPRHVSNATSCLAQLVGTNKTTVKGNERG